MGHKRQLKLIKKKIAKAGQVASLILLSIAVLLFLGSAGIFFAQKKLLQTKAMIAADAGGMYLNSQIGSYAHYLACKYIDCECSKSKTNWGMIAAVTLAVVAAGLGAWAYFGSLAAKWPITVAVAAVSKGVQNEIQLRMAVNNLNKIFKALSSRSVKERFKWDVIRYTAMILADDNLQGLIEDLRNKIEKNMPRGKTYEEYERALNKIKNKVKRRLINIYDATFGDDDWDELINDTMGALNIWNFLVGVKGQQLVPVFTVRDEDANVTLSLLATHYLRAVVWQKYWKKYVGRKLGGGTGEGATLESWRNLLENNKVDGITALTAIKDPDHWEGSSIKEDNDFFYELTKARSALEQMRQDIDKYDLVDIGIVKTCSGCDDIEYEDGPLETLKDIWHTYNDGDTPRMTPGDYYDLKQGLKRWIDRTVGVIDSFMSNVDKVIDDYKKDLEVLNGKYQVKGDYNYSWRDSLGRTHTISVSLHFKMPRIKVKKSFFKVKIKLRPCEQTMWITACRNGFCYTSSVHYSPKKGYGPTTNGWWIEGEKF